MEKLGNLRIEIDKLDAKIVQILNERAKVVVEIGKVKRSDNAAPPIYSPDREQAVMDKIKDHNKGPLPDRCLVAIYRELMSGSFFLERPLRIGFLGPEASFSHNAARLKFGRSVQYEPLSDIHAVFDEVAREHCDLGIVPVENSIAGGIVETLDALIDTQVKICAEVRMAIHHCLLGNYPMEDIQEIYSKPEVFNQCRNWLAACMAGIPLIQTGSTAQAAQTVSAKPNSASIGSKMASEFYGLNIICENIEDNPNNVTRFFVIGREIARPSGNDKSAFVFSTADKAGALVSVLQVFNKFGVNLTNIESRPSRKREQVFNFFADCQGHLTDKNVIDAIAEARHHCLQLIELGSFPRAAEVL